MKFSILVLVALFSASSFAAKSPQRHPSDLWRVGDNLDTPESAYFDHQSGVLFVSNVAGQPTQKDGNGWIAKVTFSGKNKKATVTKWSKGTLNAPKGMRAHGGKLFVADIDQVAVIDMATGEVKQPIPVKDAGMLNDVAIDNAGKIYVSDTFKNRIYGIESDKVATFAEGGALLEGPNGLWIDGDKLYVASWGEITDPATWAVRAPGTLFVIDVKTKKRTDLANGLRGNLDGLERLPNGVMVVSDFVASKVYRVEPNGQVTMLNIAPGKNSADIGVDIAGQRLFIPWMSESKVSAVDIKALFRP